MTSGAATAAVGAASRVINKIPKRPLAVGKTVAKNANRAWDVLDKAGVVDSKEMMVVKIIQQITKGESHHIAFPVGEICGSTNEADLKNGATVSASSSYGKFTPEKAFTKGAEGWHSENGMPQSLIYDFKTQKTICSVSFLPRKDNSLGNVPKDCPQKWKFEGSNDGKNWAVLLNIAKDDVCIENVRIRHPIPKPQPYKMYKFEILNVPGRGNNNRFVQIREVHMRTSASCRSHCGGKGGICSWCGSFGSCCKMGVADAKGCNGQNGCNGYHCCAETAKPKTWREDSRCGSNHLLNGKPAECNPTGAIPCCSAFGWCGASKDHCFCPTCNHFTIIALKRGPDPDPQGMNCNKLGANRCCKHFDCGHAKRCCSKWGWCYNC